MTDEERDKKRTDEFYKKYVEDLAKNIPPTLYIPPLDLSMEPFYNDPAIWKELFRITLRKRKRT